MKPMSKERGEETREVNRKGGARGESNVGDEGVIEDEQRRDRGVRRMVGQQGQTGLVPVPLCVCVYVCVYECESVPMSFCVCVSVPASLY